MIDLPSFLRGFFFWQTELLKMQAIGNIKLQFKVQKQLAWLAFKIPEISLYPYIATRSPAELQGTVTGFLVTIQISLILKPQCKIQ